MCTVSQQMISPCLLLLPQVAIVSSDSLMTGSSEMSNPHYQQVALLATANGTQIAVQVSAHIDSLLLCTVAARYMLG